MMFIAPQCFVPVAEAIGGAGLNTGMRHSMPSSGLFSLKVSPDGSLPGTVWSQTLGA